MALRKTTGILFTLFIITTMLSQACSPTQYKLTTSVSPTGAGTVTPSDGLYEAGTEVTITATAAEGYVFDNWSGGASGTSTSTTVTLDADKSVIANFSEETIISEQYNLTTSVSPTGAGTVTPSDGLYEAGTEVTITATAAEGYVFDNWSGGASGTSTSTTVTLDADKSVIANFSEETIISEQYNLTTSVSPTGAGTVTPSDGLYEAGTEVTITATAAEGYVFDNWSGGASGTSTSTTVTLDADKSVIANFSEETIISEQYNLTTSVSPTGAGTVTPSDGLYEAGTEVTITATAAEGYVFDNWSGGASGTSTSTTVTLDADKSVIANFSVEELEFTLFSTAFVAGASIPDRYNDVISPPLSWENAPAGTLSFVLIMDDPDAIPMVGYVWDHWIVYDIPANITLLAEGAGVFGGGSLPAGAKHGRNSWGVTSYGGPAPPSGSHEYVFKLYALDIAELNPDGIVKSAIETAMAGHILAQAEMSGMYP